MEERTRRRTSPGRTKVWVEPPPAGKKHHSPPPSLPGERVPVVYYLSRNRHLEHPHFMEVPLASPEGLYLRDVITRLNVLRGKGMAAMYSWSCKRSYKNGFVWHDLSEDDLVLPAHGCEYILKGSELLDQSPPDEQHNGTSNVKVRSLKQSQEGSPHSRASQEGWSSCSSPVAVIKEAPPPQPQPALLASPSASTTGDEEQCGTPHSGSSGNLSPKPTGQNTPMSGESSPSFAAYTVCKPVGAHDASTQTEDRGRELHNKDTSMTGVSNNNRASDAELQEGHHGSTQASPGGSDIIQESPHLTGTSPNGKSETLESLIRAETIMRKSCRVLDEEDIVNPMSAKLKPANLLMRLMMCGTMAAKNHRGFGLIQTYKPQVTELEFPSSPVLYPLRALRHLDQSPGSTKTTIGVRDPESERSNGTFVNTRKQEELGKGMPVLKRSLSCVEERVYATEGSKGDLVDLASFNCLPHKIKVIPRKQSRSGTLFSVTSDIRNNCGQQEFSNRTSPLSLSKNTSKRTTDPSSGKIPSSRLESFHEEKEKVNKIEERLASGARVIIQCAPFREISDDSAKSM